MVAMVFPILVALLASALYTCILATLVALWIFTMRKEPRRPKAFAMGCVLLIALLVSTHWIPVLDTFVFLPLVFGLLSICVPILRLFGFEL